MSEEPPDFELPAIEMPPFEEMNGSSARKLVTEAEIQYTTYLWIGGKSKQSRAQTEFKKVLYYACMWAGQHCVSRNACGVTADGLRDRLTGATGCQHCLASDAIRFERWFK